MKCPNYIKKAIIKRAKLADQFFDLDCIISEWIDKQGIEVDCADVHGGCESMVNPYDSAQRLLDAIEQDKKG